MFTSGKEILSLEEIKNFLDCFGINIDPLMMPGQFVEALKISDPRYANGRELLRFQLEGDKTEMSEQVTKAVMSAAQVLGILDKETQLKGDQDLVIVLGGARQSNLDRLSYVLESIKSGRVVIRKLVMAGSTRILDDTEKQNTLNYAPRAKTEADLCYAAASTLSLKFPDQPIYLVTSGHTKAGNPEVIEKAIRQLMPNGDPDSKIMVVTTQRYAQSALLDLDRVGRKFSYTNSSAAGSPANPTVVANSTPATYLSEVLRTLRAAVLHATEIR